MPRPKSWVRSTAEFISDESRLAKVFRGEDDDNNDHRRMNLPLLFLLSSLFFSPSVLRRSLDQFRNRTERQTNSLSKRDAMIIGIYRERENDPYATLSVRRVVPIRISRSSK